MEIQQLMSCGISMIMGRGRDAGGTNRTERAREPGVTAESAYLTALGAQVDIARPQRAG
jgi:hypothetical protein